jgi:hypothetical protein
VLAFKNQLKFLTRRVLAQEENILKSPQVISVSTQNKSIKDELIAEQAAFGLLYETEYFKNKKNNLLVSPFALHATIATNTENYYAVNPTLGGLFNCSILHLEVFDKTIDNLEEALAAHREKKNLSWISEAFDKEANSLKDRIVQEKLERAGCKRINDYLNTVIRYSRYMTQIAYEGVVSINATTLPNELFLKNEQIKNIFYLFHPGTLSTSIPFKGSLQMLWELRTLEVLKTEFQNNKWWQLNSEDVLENVPEYEKEYIRGCFPKKFGEPDFIELVKPGESDFTWINSDYPYPS